MSTMIIARKEYTRLKLTNYLVLDRDLSPSHAYDKYRTSLYTYGQKV